MLGGVQLPATLTDEATRDLMHSGWVPIFAPPGMFGFDIVGQPIPGPIGEDFPDLRIGGAFTGWMCPSCTAIVRNPPVHQSWHEKYGTWDLTWIEAAAARGGQ